MFGLSTSFCNVWIEWYPRLENFRMPSTLEWLTVTDDVNLTISTFDWARYLLNMACSLFYSMFV